MEVIKCVVLGDGAVGKSNLLISYTCEGIFPEDYVPTVMDNYCKTVQAFLPGDENIHDNDSNSIAGISSGGIEKKEDKRDSQEEKQKQNLSIISSNSLNNSLNNEGGQLNTSIVSGNDVEPILLTPQYISLQLCDTSGQEEYDKLRSDLSEYTSADVFLFCFSLDDPRSLENLQSRWYDEVVNYFQTHKHQGGGVLSLFGAIYSYFGFGGVTTSNNNGESTDESNRDGHNITDNIPPIILVGTKLDLLKSTVVEIEGGNNSEILERKVADFSTRKRNNSIYHMFGNVTKVNESPHLQKIREQALSIKKDIKAVAYVEVSSKTMENVNEMFEDVVVPVVMKRRREMEKKRKSTQKKNIGDNISNNSGGGGGN